MSLTSSFRQHGLSLIELLVSLVIAGVVMAGVINTVVGSKQNYLFDEQTAYIQENARFAIDTLNRDIREAGYFGGCGINSTKVANSLDPTANQAPYVATTPVIGYEGGVDVIPTPAPVNAWNNTDAFILHKSETDNSFIVTGHNANSANIEVASNHSFQEDDILVMADPSCQQIGIFAVTQTPSNKKSQHNQGTGNGNSSNCTKRLGGDFNCSGCPNSGKCTNSYDYSYPPGSSLTIFVGHMYYIAASSYDPNTPSLYRRALIGSGQLQSEELVSGIEDFQVEYGIDNDANQDGKANIYRSANQINADNAAAANNFIAWDRVVAMRIQMVMRSRDLVLQQVQTQTLLGVTNTDRRLRQLVSTTVQLRNVALPGNVAP